jgi:branched-chain amino acid transport system ATP-binding protein
MKTQRYRFAAASRFRDGPDTSVAPGNTPAGLRVENLTVRFAGARVLDGLSLTVQPGEVIGLAGRNGAGKTTTLRSISGLAHRSGGIVELDGVKVPNRPETVAQMGIAHVPEGRGIFSDLTVEENIRLGLVRSTAASTTLRPALEQAFPAVARLKQQKAGRLSGGEQQMLALFRGLISKPKVLLVDEMSLGLSPVALRTAIEALAALGRAHDIAVLVVDQNSRMLHEHCDRVYLLNNGRVEVWDDASNIASAYFE